MKTLPVDLPQGQYAEAISNPLPTNEKTRRDAPG